MDAVRAIAIERTNGETLELSLSGAPIEGTAPSAASALFACYPQLRDAPSQPSKRAAAAAPITKAVAPGPAPGAGPYRTDPREPQEPAPFFPPPPKKGG